MRFRLPSRLQKRSTPKALKSYKSRPLQFEGLERRQLMAASVGLVNGELHIVADAAGTAAEVREILPTPSTPHQSAKLTVTVTDLGSRRPTTYTFSESAVNKIVFDGSGSNDRFENFAKAALIANAINGNGGNDILRGGAGLNVIHGGKGNDIIYGGAGNDMLFGDDGNDVLNGFGGADKLYGNGGADTLISIDNATADKLWGGAGDDSFWLDRSLMAANGSLLKDQVLDATNLEMTNNYHAVLKFVNGADKTLDGDQLADPTGGVSYHDFNNQPLFATVGPTQLDVRQGSLGDCWLLAALGSAAHSNPNSIRQTVVDLGDGTYAVELGTKFYRVDGDLPTASATNTRPTYGKFGQEYCMWVPIVEKAFAFYRSENKGVSTVAYGVLAGGAADEGYKAIGCTALVSKSFTTGSTALNHIVAELNAGKAVAVQIGTPSAGTALFTKHAYMVDSINYQPGTNTPISVVLRNPWGYDGTGNDANPQDGFVTVTGTQLAASMDTFGYGIQSALV
jgi:hypothetical protein